MQITIYGLIILAYIAFIFLKITNNKKRFLSLLTLSVFLYTNITIGYIVKVGDQTIAGYFIATLFTAVAAIPFFRKLKKKTFRITMSLIGVIILGIVLNLFMKYLVVDYRGWDCYLFGLDNRVTNVLSSKHVKELIKAISFVLIAVASSKILTRADWEKILNKTIYLTKFVLLYGVLEFITVYIFKYFNLYSLILQPIFGVKESTYQIALPRGSFYQLQGLFTEPSAYAGGLFITIIALYAQKRIVMLNNSYQVKYNSIWIALCLFLMFFSMSFSSVLYISILFLFAIVSCYVNKRKYRKIIMISSLAMVFMFVLTIVWIVNSDTYYGERLNAALYIFKTVLTNPDLNNIYYHVVGIANDGSTIARLGSAIGIIRMEFAQNFLIGLGVGTANSYALFPNMLTDIGIVGTLLWGKLVIFENEINHSKYFKMTIFLFTIMCFLIIPFNYFGTDVLYLVYLLSRLLDDRGDKKDAFV